MRIGVISDTHDNVPMIKEAMIGVYGNNCAEREKLREVYAAVGKEIRGNFAEVEAGGRRIALLHGHDEALLRPLLSHGGFDVVVHGHNHQAKISWQGDTLDVNPGEVCGYVSGRRSLAVVDVETLEAELIDL